MEAQLGCVGTARRLGVADDAPDGREFAPQRAFDLVDLLVEGEMAGIEQVDFGIRQIALERFGGHFDG